MDRHLTVGTVQPSRVDKCYELSHEPKKTPGNSLTMPVCQFPLPRRAPHATHFVHSCPVVQTAQQYISSHSDAVHNLCEHCCPWRCTVRTKNINSLPRLAVPRVPGTLRS